MVKKKKTAEKDVMFDAALEYITEVGIASVTMLQRKFGIGYARAAKLIEAMDKLGYLGEVSINEPRKVLLTKEEFNQKYKRKKSHYKQIFADFNDELFIPALKFCVEHKTASISILVRNFGCGYARAARIIDQMERKGYITGENGNQAREVKLTRYKFNKLFGDQETAE